MSLSTFLPTKDNFFDTVFFAFIAFYIYKERLRAIDSTVTSLRGHGACCGIYKSGPMLQSGIIQNDTSKNVKSSSVSQKEVINRRKGCDNRGGGKMDSDGHVLYNFIPIYL